MSTPHDDEAVRRLLAEAGGPESIPPDVAARLDATLTDLVSERSDPTTASTLAPVTDLAARRRRRIMRGVVAAAAAVVVVGLGLQFTDDIVTSDDVSTLADGEPERGNDAAGSIAPEEEEKDSGGDRLFAEADGSAGSGGARNDAPRTLDEAQRRTVDEPVRTLQDRHLRDELTGLQDRYLPAPATADYSGAIVSAPQGFTCADMDLGRGIFVAARYRGEPALVGFREPVGSTQVADVLRCGTGDVLRSMTLPAP